MTGCSSGDSRRPSWHATSACAAALSCVLAALPLRPGTAVAQTVRGTTLSITGDPVPGVVLLLADSTGATVRRALGDARGSFVLSAPAAGTYELRTLRLGFRPAHVTLRGLRPGQDTTLRVDLIAVPVMLERVVVQERRSCGRRTDPGAVTALWSAVRSALEAQELTATSRRYRMRITTTERRFAPDGVTLRHESRATREGWSARPFASLPADSLAQVGYVTETKVQVRSGAGVHDVLYRGPDAQVLLSERFAGDHCFDLVGSPDAQQHLVGLTFRPVHPRHASGVVDVHGTLWVDRHTSELRRIDFAYDGLPNGGGDEARGTVEYLRLPTGGWIVRRWEIRMPQWRSTTVQVPDGGLGRVRSVQRLELAEVHTSGGEVGEVVSEGRVVWTTRTAHLAGIVRRPPAGEVGERSARVRLRLLGVDDGAAHAVEIDSLGGFRIDSLEPRTYRLAVMNLDADSLAIAPDTVTLPAVEGEGTAPREVRAPDIRDLVRRLCGREAGDTSARAIVGVVRSADETPVTDATVSASFLAKARVVAGGRLVASIERRSVRTDAQGRFLVCDVPGVRPIQLHARTPRSIGETVTLRIESQRAYAPLGLRVPR